MVALWIDSSGILFQVFTEATGPSSFVARSLAAPVTNEWHHWAGTFDGSTVNLYRDGVLEQSTAYSGPPCYPDIDVEIGKKFNQNRWSGLIDEVKVFNYALDAEEIAEENSSGKITICHIPPGNPSNAKTKSIGSGSVFDHLAHGDTLGPCP